MSSFKACARDSQLSRRQVEEIAREMPHLKIKPVFLKSQGDIDLRTSLRDMPKNDFFTREIDEKVLSGECDFAVHSAKDLPENIPDGLIVAAITRGVSTWDTLLFRKGESLESLERGARVGCSSKKREKAVQKMRSDLQFVDIRGAVPARIEQLDRGDVDALVVAEAALERLGIQRRGARPIFDPPSPLQGKLAIVTRVENASLFASIDIRKKKNQMWLGLRPPSPEMFHHPVIKTKPFGVTHLPNLDVATHLIFTSQSSVEYLPSCNLSSKKIIAIGPSTKNALLNAGIEVDFVAENSTQEGLIELIDKLSLKNAHILIPRSSLARSVLEEGLAERGIKHTLVDLYKTEPNIDLGFPDLTYIEELIFTSSSCVDAYLALYGPPPEKIKCTPIGPVTKSKKLFKMHV